jgi:hypothetical protein
MLILALKTQKMLKAVSLQSLFTSFFICLFALCSAQVRIVSFGGLTGLTSTYTWDQGINDDSRYKPGNGLKFSPLGLSYGVDYDGLGFEISPQVFSEGQNFNVIDYKGVNNGTRKISLQYLNVPVAIKLRLISLPSNKLSFESGVSPALLLSGSEKISHNSGKYRFPLVVYPNLPDGYNAQGSLVSAPQVSNVKMLDKNDFKALQLYTFIGVRSDWYFSTQWRATFSARLYYGMFDNRSKTYLNKLENYQTLYDLPGKRRDVVGQFTIGISRYISIDKKEKDRQDHVKKNIKRYIPPKKLPKPPEKKSKLPH